MMLGVGVKEDELQSILNYLSTGKAWCYFLSVVRRNFNSVDSYILNGEIGRGIVEAL